jgi:hypothetical protein
MIVWQLYIVAGLGSLALLQYMSARGWNTRFKRVFAGTGSGTLGYGWLSNYTTLESYLTAAGKGHLGASGFVLLTGLAALVAVMVWNMASTRRHLVR